MRRTGPDVTRVLLAVAGLGFAHSFFGQLYEAVVDVPGRIARDPLPSLGSAGSPTRYFLPAAPITRAALVAALATGRRRPELRGPLLAAVAATAVDTAITVHLVRRVNGRVLVAGSTVPAAERRRLLRRWHRLNAVRLLTGAVGGIAVAAAATADRSGPRRG